MPFIVGQTLAPVGPSANQWDRNAAHREGSSKSSADACWWARFVVQRLCVWLSDEAEEEAWEAVRRAAADSRCAV